MITHQNQYQRLDPALNNKSRNLTALLPVQPGPLLILMMKQLQKAHRALGIKPHQTLTHQGRMWITLTWKQPLETPSHAQTWMKCPSKLPTRGTRRGYRLPVDWAEAIFGQKLNWKGLAKIIRKYGDMSMNVLEQSGNALLWKTATPLKCKKWWTNCYAILRPHQRVRGWDWWQGKDSGAVIKTIPCPLLPVLWKRYNEGHGRPAGATLQWCNLMLQCVLQSQAELILPQVF